MFWESSLSFNIVQQPLLLLLLLSLFFPFIHLSLSLRSGVSLSGSVLQRWVLQLSPAPGPEQEPRGPVGGGCLGQKAQPIWKQKHTLRYLYATLQTQIWRLCLFFWTSLRRTCTSSCLSPTAWSIWICQAQTALWTQWVSILSVYLLAEDRQMFYVQRLKKRKKCISLCTLVSPDWLSPPCVSCSYLGLFWGGVALIFPFWIFPKIPSPTG